MTLFICSCHFHCTRKPPARCRWFQKALAMPNPTAGEDGGREIEKYCLVFMCDDVAGWGNDTEEWSRSIYLLLEELKNRKKLAGSVLFTRKTGEQIRQRSQSSDFRREKDRNEYIVLYKTLDVLVTQQANRYASAEKRSVFYASEEAGARLSWLLDPTK